MNTTELLRIWYENDQPCRADLGKRAWCMYQTETRPACAGGRCQFIVDVSSALEPDAGHPSTGGESPTGDEGDPEHQTSHGLASGSSASEACLPHGGPNSPLGGRARTPGDVAEEAWLRMNAKLYPETWKP